jgi:outer membrane lipoprotein SlyB
VSKRSDCIHNYSLHCNKNSHKVISMKRLTTTIVFIGGTLLSGCYSYGGWTPTVDTYNDPNAYRMNQDMAECKQIASQASGGAVKETAIGAGTGAALGAAAGALIGAFTGSAGTGAAIGAATGGLGGGAYKGLSTDERYKNAYNNCMSNRGHQVVR